jgi:hypothetical protein
MWARNSEIRLFSNVLCVSESFFWRLRRRWANGWNSWMPVITDGIARSAQAANLTQCLWSCTASSHHREHGVQGTWMNVAATLCRDTVPLFSPLPLNICIIQTGRDQPPSSWAFPLYPKTFFHDNYQPDRQSYNSAKCSFCETNFSFYNNTNSEIGHRGIYRTHGIALGWWISRFEARLGVDTFLTHFFGMSRSMLGVRRDAKIIAGSCTLELASQ